MSLGTANKKLLPPPSGAGQSKPRHILRGEISDKYGSGEFILIRQNQCGFDDTVEFIAEKSGIAALNSVTLPDLSAEEQKTDADPLLEFRYSVIPDKGCSIEYLQLHIRAVDIDLSKFGLVLNWRGENPAKIRKSDVGLQEEYSPLVVRQNEALNLATVCSGTADWFIEIPSSTFSVSVQGAGDDLGKNPGSISIVADAVFVDKNQIWEKRQKRYSQLDSAGTGRIQPDKVIDLIEKVETSPARIEADEVPPTGHAAEETEIAISREHFEEEIGSAYPEMQPYTPSSTNIDLIISQDIELFFGEDIILSTSNLFEGKVQGDASFVSANLPEWIFLDQRSGDLMGTVPDHTQMLDMNEFSIYAVDNAGNSAKAIIPVKCSAQNYPAGEDLRDYSYKEGNWVDIPTSNMFVDFGLSVTNLEFVGEGLPEGLHVDRSSGLVSGQLVKGDAKIDPYTIVITAADGSDAGSGISMQFLLDVTGDAHLLPSSSNLDTTAAMQTLYRMNRESGQILAAGMIRKMGDGFDEFVVQSMSLTGNRLSPETEYSNVPMLNLFAPDRYLYLRIDTISEDDGFDLSYGVQINDQEELPDWIECSPEGFICIRCSPARRYIDLEIMQNSADGKLAIFDVCVDTFEASMMPMHRSVEAFTDKQLRELTAA